jgi:ABC-type dipeptide/oligopeptide/nickel transport system permease component
MVHGVVTVMVVLSVLVNLIVDVVYAVVDPRVAQRR